MPALSLLDHAPMGGCVTNDVLTPHRTRISWTAEFVLVCAAVADALSDNWVHGLFLLGAAGAVEWDVWRPEPPPAKVLLGGPPRPRWLAPALALASVAYVALVGSWDLYTWPVTLAVLAVGVLATVVTWRGVLRARPVPPRLSRVGARCWATVFVAAGVWELGALLQQPSLQTGSQAHPTISVLMDSVLASSQGRVVALAGWLGVGWFLLRQAPGGQAP
jgi:hypothetical protein